MADVKMSSLPPASAIAGGELVPIVQGGQTVRWTVPADPIIEQSSDDIAFTGGAIDGVTLGGTAKTIGGVYATQVSVGQAALAAAGVVPLIPAVSGHQYRIRDLFVSGAVTNFSGGGGDRNIAITDGTSTWSVLPAASLASLAPARWGDTLVPWPAGANLAQASVASQAVRAVYSGGSADYTAGALVIVVVFERIA